MRLCAAILERAATHSVRAFAARLAVCFAIAATAITATQTQSTSPPAAAAPGLQRFATAVRNIVAANPAQKSFWGILVQDQDTSEVLFDLNADRYFSPASTTKLFTSALALAKLGRDYRFRTTLEASAAPDSAGHLAGDLVLVGRGDPDLSNRTFPYQEKTERQGPPEKALADLVDVAVASGLKQIDGGVIADDSYFPYDRYPSGWEIEDIKYAFGAAISSIAVNDNTFSIQVQPGSKPTASSSIAVQPDIPYFSVDNQITTGPAASSPEFKIDWEPGSHLIALRGSIPWRSAPVSLVLAVPEPAAYAAQLLKTLLEQRGVRVLGQPAARHIPPPTGSSVVLAEHLSPPLAEIVRTMNKTSENLHAEMLLRTVARVTSGNGSLESALKIEQDFLQSVGLSPTDAFLTDGSGLSRRNLVTPRAEVALLRYAAAQSWGSDLLASLPVAGKDGTLGDRMKETPAQGRIQAKTGSLEHARALAGYATTLFGEHLVFAFFVNNYTLHPHEAAGILDSLALAMVTDLAAPGSSARGQNYLRQLPLRHPSRRAPPH